MDPILTLNEDFFVGLEDDALEGLSPAGEVVDPGFSAPPGVRHDLSLTPQRTKPRSELEQNLSTFGQLQNLTPARASVNQWDPRLIIDLAVGVDALPEILDRYDLSLDEFNALSQTQVFRRELALVIRDVRENGLSFTQKARVQAESYLEVMDQLVYDVATPASTRLEAIRSMVKYGKLEPKEDKEGGGTNAQQINIQISF